MNNNDINNTKNIESFYSDLSDIIESAQRTAYKSVDSIVVLRNWLLGKRISEEELTGTYKERYGENIMSDISKRLSQKFNQNFNLPNLYRFVKFYKLYPDLICSLGTTSNTIYGKKSFATLSQNSLDVQNQFIFNSSFLSWSHYTLLMQINDSKARSWYEKESLEQTWSFRTLRRNIQTQYYERMLLSHNDKNVENEMKEKTSEYQSKLEFIRNPVIAEFLGMQENTSYLESDLEQAIITNLQRFLMELGKGYAFVARQQHIHTEKQDYYIDLVFYNYLLQCFVLIDLKIGKITHQDVGQMDMYVRMYDELKKTENHNPTLGIVLCSETDEDIARYSVLHGNEQLFAAKYKLCLPTEEQLKAEIETQKEIFYLQHPELKKEK